MRKQFSKVIYIHRGCNSSRSFYVGIYGKVPYYPDKYNKPSECRGSVPDSKIFRADPDPRILNLELWIRIREAD
jgi:hypothetical protein